MQCKPIFNLNVIYMFVVLVCNAIVLLWNSNSVVYVFLKKIHNKYVVPPYFNCYVVILKQYII